MTFIEPIDQSMQERVVNEFERYRLYAASVFNQTFASLPVRFDLKGRAAGMYCVKSYKGNIERSIRFNPWLFAKYPDDSWENTIPHELAHYIADCLYGMRTIRPHGKEWKSIMHSLGAEPVVRASYNLDGIPVRQVKRYLYRCDCRDIPLSSYRHKKIQSGMQRYRCKDCLSDLQYIT